LKTEELSEYSLASLQAASEQAALVIVKDIDPKEKELARDYESIKKWAVLNHGRIESYSHTQLRSKQGMDYNEQ
jgi:hypothetical protein